MKHFRGSLFIYAFVLCLVFSGRVLADANIEQSPNDTNLSVGRPQRTQVPEAFETDQGPETPSLWHGSFIEELLIEGEDKSLTQKYIQQYSSPGGRSWLQAVMKRGEPYIAFIHSQTAARSLPPELAYLPVIESAFSATAVSKSGAAGLWQFMKNSIAPFDMRVDDWVDERRDFWKSTEAALRKLDENYRYFNDWPLALAAYNAGLGAVKRACDKAGVRDYWILSEKGYLKTETIHYVPKFIAAAVVLSRAGRLDLDLGWPEEKEWTRVQVGRTVDLGLLADKAEVSLDVLKKGNPELRYGVTPPDKKYQLKVLASDAEKIAETLARKDFQLIRYYFHVVRSGDTLSALSRHYGVSVDHIIQSNPGLQAKYLKLGARVLVPAFKEVGPYQREKSLDATIVFEGSHLVKKGETLWSIALAYDVDPEILAQANGMELSSILREGRVLKSPIRKLED
ncbi:LysM peptidoglycan-binding domain-containing protein [Treponema sp.]